MEEGPAADESEDARGEEAGEQALLEAFLQRASQSKATLSLSHSPARVHVSAAQRGRHSLFLIRPVALSRGYKYDYYYEYYYYD